MSDGRRPLLLRGGTVVSLDAKVGVLPQADVLLIGERIAEVGASHAPADAEIVDASGMIVMPGLVNAHMHTWQTALRGAAANWTLLEYFKHMHAGLATRFRPDDIQIATLAGALNQLHCGTTTLVDWCHNNPTPAHTDAAVAGLQQSGIRAVFLHGSPKPDPKPGEPPFWEIPHPRAEIERLRRGALGDDTALVRLGMAILGPHYSTYEVAQHDFRLARDFGLMASMHCAGGAARVPDGWMRLDAEGLLDNHCNIVHGNNLSDLELSTMVERGVSFSVTPEGEMTQGHGFSITGRLRALGARPSLGVDLESVLSGDMFTVARMALGQQRSFDNDRARRDSGALPPTSTITVQEALEWITIDGARAFGLDDRIGSLTPGKQADIVLVRPTLGMWPVHDPVASLVTQTSAENIDSVMVAGTWRKRHGRLLDDALPQILQALAASGRRILEEQKIKTMA
jgi:5-methylthioadenosine/S-adenosylhomocysteine deaminase